MKTENSITFCQYTSLDGENNAIRAIIDGTTLIVPLDPANRHYAEILRQVEGGTLTIEPADETE